MSLGSYFLARRAGLPKRKCRARITEDITVTAGDGVGLATMLFEPTLPGPHPTILMREPYGLSSFATVGEIYAERGYNVVMQACRGTDRSGGEFDPFGHERDDGLATLDWIKRQAWYDGRLGTTGPSYLGYAQWAICDALPKQSAMAIKVTSSEFRSVVFPGGGLAVGLWLSWIQTIEGIKGNPMGTARRMFTGGIERATLRATMKLPLRDADRRVTGHAVPFWKRWMAEAIGNNAFWQPLDHSHRLGIRTPPVSFVSGWYDFMLDQLLRDYARLVDAGQKPPLTIGPWTHVGPELQLESLRQTLDWMDEKLLGDTSRQRDKPVRIWISGADRWHESETYPPTEPDAQIWQLHPGSVLSQRPVKASPPDTYTYDPADPTPAVGGAMFAFQGAGPVDQAPLEKRKDVLVYSSEPLVADTTIIGQVRIALYARASLPNADFFVRLSDVDPSDKSINVCDGIVRKTSADPAVKDDVWKLSFRTHATAHTFKRGHRLRVVVASGAHPRYARNTGTDEPLGEATTLLRSDIEIFHDPQRPSAVHLPVVELREA